MSENYWAKRTARAQDRITQKNVRQVEKQLAAYYSTTMEGVIKDFEATYNRLLNDAATGRKPTPADLYKLDKYWRLQGQMRKELEKLGHRKAALMSKAFETNYFEVYYSYALRGKEAYSTLDISAVQQMINSIWCADGKTWSSRIWTDTAKLQEALNNALIECVAAGKKTSDLKKLLQDQFGVSYNRADALVRTEMAHIQTQAAQQRYKDYGIKRVEVFVDEDERTCPICAKHEGEKYNINDTMPVPFHPRCRCCMVPVIE